MALIVSLSLVAAGVALPAWAEEAGAPAVGEARVNELTVEYTMRYQFGGPAQAIPVAEQALAAAEAAFGPDHERVAQVLNDLGHLYQQPQGDLERAEHLHERALEIRERLFGGDGAEVVQSLNNLAKVHVAQGRYAQAQARSEQALAVAERHVSPTDPFLIGVLEPYAAALRGGGKLEAAEAVEARIEAIRNRAGKRPEVQGRSP